MIAQRIRNCQECVSLNLLEDAKEMIDAGKDVFNLATVETISGFDDEEIASEATNNEEVKEYLSLEAKISEKLRIENGLDYPKEEIIITNGMRSALSLTFHTILNPLDEVIIPLPYAKGYPEMVKLAGAKAVLVNLSPSDRYKLTPRILKNAITAKTRAVILNNPINPTGLIYTVDELLALSEVIIENKLMIIADETDESFIFDGKSHIAIASLSGLIKNQTILINDLSDCSQERESDLSYIVANKTIISGIKKIQNYLVSGPSARVKQKAKEALIVGNRQTDQKLAFLNKQRQMMFSYLDQIEKINYIESQATRYVLVDISEVLKTKQNAINSDSSLGFSKALLKRANTLVMPGEVFGLPGTIRLCFAVESLDEGFKNLIEFIEKY